MLYSIAILEDRLLYSIAILEGRLLYSIAVLVLTRICASLGSRMKFKTLCYPVFGRHKNTALPSF